MLCHSPVSGSCPSASAASKPACMKVPAYPQNHASFAAKLDPRGCPAYLTGLQSCLDRTAYALLSPQSAHFIIQTGAWGVNEIDSDGGVVLFEGG